MTPPEAPIPTPEICGTVNALDNVTCEELKGHAGQHIGRKWLTGPGYYGVDYVARWGEPPEDDRYKGDITCGDCNQVVTPDETVTLWHMEGDYDGSFFCCCANGYHASRHHLDEERLNALEAKAAAYDAMMNELAEKAVASIEARKDEDLDEWAENLVRSVEGDDAMMKAGDGEWRKITAAPSGDWPHLSYGPSPQDRVALPEPLIDAILAHRAAAQQADELNALFDMQHKREMEAVKRWRKSGKLAPLTLPDYGTMLDWLLDEAQQAAGYKAALEAIRDGTDDECMGDETRDLPMQQCDHDGGFCDHHNPFLIAAAALTPQEAKRE